MFENPVFYHPFMLNALNTLLLPTLQDMGKDLQRIFRFLRKVILMVLNSLKGEKRWKKNKK